MSRSTATSYWDSPQHCQLLEWNSHRDDSLCLDDTKLVNLSVTEDIKESNNGFLGDQK